MQLACVSACALRRRAVCRPSPSPAARAATNGRRHPRYGPRREAAPCSFFFLNDGAPPDIYPLPLPAALPIKAPPAEATVMAPRQTPALFGLGLVDAIPDEAILHYADPADRNGDGISGRPNMVGGRVGRF